MATDRVYISQIQIHPQVSSEKPEGGNLQEFQMEPRGLKPPFLTSNGQSKPTAAQQHPDQTLETLLTGLQMPIWFSTLRELI